MIQHCSGWHHFWNRPWVPHLLVEWLLWPARRFARGHLIYPYLPSWNQTWQWKNQPCIVFIYIFSFKCPCKEISHCHVWLHESINLDGLSQIGTGLQVILPQLEIEITCCKWWRVTYMRVIIWSYLNLNIFKINPTERSHERIAFMWGVARTWAMHGYALFFRRILYGVLTRFRFPSRCWKVDGWHRMKWQYVTVLQHRYCQKPKKRTFWRWKRPHFWVNQLL